MGCTGSTNGGGAVSEPERQRTHENARHEKVGQPEPEVPKPPKRTFKTAYTLDKQLGEGAFAVVHLAINNETGKKVAVKIFDKKSIPDEEIQNLHAEVEIMSKMDHPNIVSYLDFFDSKKHFYLVLEFLEGGELFDRIVQKTSYNEKEARDLVLIMLRAMKYMHDLDITHRDMKPENLLLTSKEDDANVKIADFGFAVQGRSMQTQCGTPSYMAPEILKNKTYGKAVDMWAIGVITFILLGGYAPFNDDNQKRLFSKIKEASYEFDPEYWGAVSDEAKDLISGLLHPIPKKRLTVDQCLEHSWVTRADSELEARNLDANIETLRKYQATRRFRAAVNAVRAVNRVGNMVAKITAGAKKEEAEEAAAAAAAAAAEGGETSVLDDSAAAAPVAAKEEPKAEEPAKEEPTAEEPAKEEPKAEEPATSETKAEEAPKEEVSEPTTTSTAADDEA